MAFVPGYQYDVFISYAWVNNQDKWVSHFRKKLKEDLEERLGRIDAAAFFVDTAELPRNSDYEIKLNAGIRGSATIVVLFSPGYLASEACCGEIRLFARTIRDADGDPASSGRIFFVPIDDVKPEDWPLDFREIFRNNLGHRFWVEDDDGLPIKSRDLANMNRLRTELANQLKHMKEEAQKKPAVEQAAPSTPTVCLAKVTADLRPRRDQFANYLTKSGLRVLPEKPYSADPKKFRQAFEADLKQSDVFVQILGEAYSDRTDEFLEGEEKFQYETAVRLNKAILQWHDESVRLDKIDDPIHKEMVSKAACTRDWVEFMTLIQQRARRVRDVVGPELTAEEPRLALVKVNEADAPLAKEITDILKESQVFCRVTKNGRSMVERLREIPYDALVVVCGNCPDDWVETRGDELQQVFLDLKDQAPLRAFYLGDANPLVPFTGADVLTVWRQDKEGIRRLIESIQARKRP